MSADQNNPAPTVAVAFDTEESSSGDLSRSGSTITGLKAGKVYLLTGALDITNTSTCSATFEFYDVAGAASIDSWVIRAPTSGNNNAQGTIGVALFIPSVDTSVQINLTQITAGADIRGNGSGYGEPYFGVVELGRA